MTVSDAIIKWLKGFDSAEYWKMKTIDTGLQSASVDSYSLVKEPVQNVKSFITGKKIFTEHYMLQARLSTQTKTERIDNNGFGEALESWVMGQNREKQYPLLGNGLICKGITVTTPFYMGRTDENTAIYQLTIAIKYEKEN